MRRPILHVSWLAVGLLAACSSESKDVHAEGAHHWSYAAAGGPEHWCDLDPANSACCRGTEQSPIDIVTAGAIAGHAPSMVLTDPTTVFDVANNGHTVQASLRPGAAKCALSLDGERYELQQFHVHAPSEHTIDGKHAPLELHFVHKSAKGALAVVGVLVEPGEANEEIEKVWKLAPAHAGSGGIAAGVDLTNILPAARVNFRYPGSLTTPPCSERVQWIVMETPITMSEEQIAKIQGMFGGPEFPNGNARPVQPLGARAVVVDLGT
jgi:carbonic anhydrase